MDLSRDDILGESLSGVKSEASTATDDGQQWEDFTRVGSWEELIGCVEGVLREWSCSGGCFFLPTPLLRTFSWYAGFP